jgi:hypothetical protein
MRYSIITSKLPGPITQKHLDQFTSRVNMFIHSQAWGWQPQGGMTISQTPSGTMFAQALICHGPLPDDYVQKWRHLLEPKPESKLSKSHLVKKVKRKTWATSPQYRAAVKKFIKPKKGKPCK